MTKKEKELIEDKREDIDLGDYGPIGILLLKLLDEAHAALRDLQEDYCRAVCCGDHYGVCENARKALEEE